MYPTQACAFIEDWECIRVSGPQRGQLLYRCLSLCQALLQSDFAPLIFRRLLANCFQVLEDVTSLEHDDCAVAQAVALQKRGE